MKIKLLKNVVAVSFMFAFFAVAASSAYAVSGSNLEVRPWIGNANPTVESPYQYTVRVKNIGNRNALGVKATVSFPLTNTSPNKFILGKLTGLNPGCSVVANKLVCNYLPNGGILSPNATAEFTFNFEFQVASTAPTMSVLATTTSTNEQNPLNNTLAFTPTLAYVTNQVTTGDYIVTSCSGRGLTSFYECELYPSSQQSFVMHMDSNTNMLSIPLYAGYTGLWDQTSNANVPANQSLHFTVSDGLTDQADFNGLGISGTCFEGLTTFPGNTSGYNSAYKVCRQ